MPSAFPAGLEQERGYAGGGGSGFWADLITIEETPELQWPNSVIVFDRMRRTDAQTSSVLRATNLPIMGARWGLHGSDVRPEVMALCRRELGLIPDDLGRQVQDYSGVKWRELLRHALLHLPLGFMAFEQVYRVGPPGAGLEALGGREVAHIRKLAPRMPRLIQELVVARDGGLKGIKQNVRVDDDGLTYEERLIETDRLVVFVNEREGADWYGNSILRASYKHWFIKDALIQLGAMGVERNSMGLPVVGYPSGGDRALALEIARNARAGEDAGVALPHDYTLALEGVTGALKDEMPLVKYHDQAIGRNALTMLLDLGHDDGARALGDTFLTFLLMALDSIAGYVGEVLTEHVIQDLVRINFGAGETYPILRAEPIEPKAPATTAALKDLVEAGILIPDDGLEVHERRRHALPMRPGLPIEPVSEDIEREEDVPVMPADDDDPVVEGDPLEPPEEPEEPEEPAEAEPATTPQGYAPDELLKLVNAAAILIRSGFSPENALTAVGLDPIEHLGLLPITVQKPQGGPVAGLGRMPSPTQVARAMGQAGLPARRRLNPRVTKAKAAGSDLAGVTTAELEDRLAKVQERLAARR
jgi:hypothetical protein